MRLLFVFILFPALCWAEAPEENRLATGFGIAAPNMSSFVNVTNGFTAENPAGVMYQNGARGSLQVVRNSGINDIGLEAGYSGSSLGAAVGTYTPGCTGCFGRVAGVIGGALAKSVFAGLRYETSNSIPTYGAGFLFNATGTHRFGLSASYKILPTANSNVTAYAGGYAYVEKKQTIAIELEKKQDAAASDVTNSVMLASIGYQRRVESLQVSVSYQRRLNDASLSNEAFWLGAGFNGQTWHLALYSQYNLNFMAVLSAFF